MATKKNTSLAFVLNKIETLQYAILKDNVDDGDLAFSIEFGFGIDTEQKLIRSLVKYLFMCNNEPAIVLETAVDFAIEPAVFDEILTQKNNYKIAKENAIHFAMINVGTARGILHEKTNGTALNNYPIPTINIPERITEDVIFSVDEAQ